ncbi:MAG TPA: hypothetical protein PKC84_11480, partial [Paracoccaceae bacterium]|nr:hypothetical protein [Paracoccaceae bacterium]
RRRSGVDRTEQAGDRRGARRGVGAGGGALPMACDTTEAGRRINRRVEVWLHPIPEWDGPPAAE